jgi:hypothetical protein
MGMHSVIDVERLLLTVRFEAPATLPEARGLDFKPRRRVGTTAMGVVIAAVTCTVLLVYVFWTALLGLKG